RSDHVVACFFDFKLLISLKVKNKSTSTSKTATTGITKARKVMTTAEMPSIIDTRKLPKPPVTTVLVPLTVLAATCVTEAVPPPAMMAILQVKKGSKSPMKEAVKSVPAIKAKGAANIFTTLSTQGI